MIIRIAVAFLFCSSLPVWAATFTIGGQEQSRRGYHQIVVMSGQIEPGDADRLALVVANLPRGERDLAVVVSLDSPGGNFVAALELTRLIASEGFGTHVAEDAQCLSGCALAFMAGRRYGEDSFLPRRNLAPGAVLGFHAPFVFGAIDDGIAPEIARTLLPDAERAAALAAAEMVQLSLDEIMPVSLVRELLTYEAQSFLYVETIDQLGRWNIDIAGTEAMATPEEFEPEILRQAAERFCDNYRFWQFDVAFPDRELDQRFGDFGALTLNTQCETEVVDRVYRFTFQDYETGQRDQGPILHWQTLRPTRRFGELTPEEVSGPFNFRAPFDPRDEPPSQVEGVCNQGFQWVGGWGGFAWSDATAHATFRTCSNDRVTETPFRIYCAHGSSMVELIIDGRFLPPGITNEVLMISVDGQAFPAALGEMGDYNGIQAYIAGYGRGHPLFDAMRIGQMLTLQIAGFDMTLHLKGSDKTIRNMQASCL